MCVPLGTESTGHLRPSKLAWWWKGDAHVGAKGDGAAMRSRTTLVVLQALEGKGLGEGKQCTNAL